MKAPNMATITASLERSLRNCSLNNENGAEEGIIGRSSISDDNDNLPNGTVSDISLELNSHLSLPYYWEQGLDLKTGEVYDINWRDGVKATKDPRTAAEYGGDFYSEEEEEDDGDDSWYDSSESSPSSSRDYDNHHRVEEENDNVLVVAGCKSCHMYFMVPKRVEDCPKCNGHLLRFDRSQSSSPSP